MTAESLYFSNTGLANYYSNRWWHAIMRTPLTRTASREDLESAARLALWRAARDYAARPRNAKFATFARFYMATDICRLVYGTNPIGMKMSDSIATYMPKLTRLMGKGLTPEQAATECRVTHVRSDTVAMAIRHANVSGEPLNDRMWSDYLDESTDARIDAESLLSSLTDLQRDAICRVFGIGVKEQRICDIAEEKGVSRHAIASRFRRGLSRIRETVRVA